MHYFFRSFYRYTSSLVRLLRRRIDIFLLLLAIVYVLLTIKHMSSTSAIGMSGDTMTEEQKLQAQLSKRLPDAVVIGVPKGGARALITFLEMHPKIKTADGQINFFNIPDNFNRGLDWYRERMPLSSPDQMVIERSVGYFVSEGVAERLHNATNGTAKIILVVRDPTMRSISEYADVKSKNPQVPAFEKLVIDPATGLVNIMYGAVRYSLYHNYLQKWLEVFPLNQILLVDGDVLRKTPLLELAKVEKFLGVQPALNEQNLYMNKTQSNYYCARSPEIIKCVGHPKDWKQPQVDPEIIRSMQKYFRPNNELFFKMANRTFDWL